MKIKSIFTMLVLLLGVGQAWGEFIEADKLQYCTGALATPEVKNATNINSNEWYVIYIAKNTTKYYIKDVGGSLSLSTTAPTFGQEDGYLFNINSGKILSAKTGKYLYGSYATSWGITTYSLSTNSTNSTTFTVSGTDGIKISCSLNSKTVYLRKNGNYSSNFAFTTEDSYNAWTLVPVTFKKNTVIKFYNGDEEVTDNSNTNPWNMTIGGSENSLTAKLFWPGDGLEITGKEFTYSTQPNPSATIDIVSNTGVITPKGAGTAIISATFTGDTDYNATSATYHLKVNKKTSKLVFNEATYSFPMSQSGTAQVIAHLIWDPDNGGNGDDISGTVTYSSDDETVARVSESGVLTLNKVGQTTIRANYAETVGVGPSSASYQLIVSDPGIQYTYRVHVSGGPKDGEGIPYGRLVVKNASPSINGEKADGDTFDSELLSRSNFDATDVDSYNPGHTYVANIALSEVIDGKVDVQLSYAEQFTWTLTINRGVVDSDAAGKGTSSGTTIVVYISGKPYRTGGPFTSTLGEMSSNFITATNIDGYEYSVDLDNDNHTITVTYSVYTHRSPEYSTFIRLRNAHSSQYITHVSGESALKTTAKSEDAIIYFENLADPLDPSTKGTGRFLFYKSGRYTTATALTDIGNVGANIKFTNEGNTAYFNVVDVNSALMLEEGSSDGNGGNTLTTSSDNSNLSRWYIEPLNALPVKITQAGHGYATLYCPVDLEVPVGVRAYVATDQIADASDRVDYLITLQRLTNDVIPSGTPVVLFSEQAVEQDVTFSFPIVSGAEHISDLWSGLNGTYPTKTTTSGDYALQPTQGSATVGFYPWESATLAPFKAYIPATVSPAKYRFVFDGDEASAIDNVTVVAPSLVSTRYFTTNGVQIDKPARNGITIVVDYYNDGSMRSRKSK